MASSLFRALAGICRSMVIANTGASLIIMISLVVGGYIIPRPSIPKWMRWAYWISPLSYGETVVTINEFLAPRWREVIYELNVKHVTSALDRVKRCQDESTISMDVKLGMTLAFQPSVLCFQNVHYFVDMPVEMQKAGVTEKRLHLLRDVTGAFRPAVMIALMGNDIHFPQVTVHESLLYPAWLRLAAEIDSETKRHFVTEVMELVELDDLKDALVGSPGVSGLSTEQRKRLTIAVELVANPSIIFMDEPTSGLDARAAAIVMGAVRNTMDRGRTVVCTIHQPSIDIFEAFDEQIPGWWVWYYWICPISWTLNGLITSQYGDMTKQIRINGKSQQSVEDFLKDYFGFHRDMLGIVAAVLVIFPVFFAIMFAVGITRLNFQRR
ncbi:hypothetical protein SUGI_1117670 [Cryptomeria japonica]|nr:hypothetical protein SUGI_1117670 [Cryptomeria japonica]